MSTLSTQQENLYLNAPTFFVYPKSVKIILIVAVDYVFVSVAWQALIMQILFKLNFMIAVYILWAMLTMFSFSMWFIVRLAWIKNTRDKNECFWICLVGTFIIQALLVVMVEVLEKPKTTVPTEKVKISVKWDAKGRPIEFKEITHFKPEMA